MEINSGATVPLSLGDPVPPDGYDFQSIITHECGHFLGMAHSGDDRATMFAHYTAGTTYMRTLTDDDRPASAPSTCPAAIAPWTRQPRRPARWSDEACDPTPRHGSQSVCAPPLGCAVSDPGGRSARDSRPHGVAQAVAAGARRRATAALGCDSPRASWPCRLRRMRRVVAREDELRDVVTAAARAPRVAVDLEASGMFAYRARICTVQLAWDERRSTSPWSTRWPLRSLRSRSCSARVGRSKIVHDVAFDARLLAESGVALGNVHDTAVAARMLSRLATGLATLLDVELGVHIGKTMQQHDWRMRPLDDRMLEYLAADVVHLEALEQKLWTEVGGHGIEDEVLEETRYRLATAIAATQPPEVVPPYARVKGAGRLAERELAVLRVAAELREREAERRDVPPHRIASADTLIAIARARPQTAQELARVRGLPASTPAGRSFATALAPLLATAGDHIPESERITSSPFACRSRRRA